LSQKQGVESDAGIRGHRHEQRQLTLPAAVHRQLGIDAGDRVAIVIEDVVSASLRRVEHDVRSVRGLIATPSGLESQDCDELIEEAMADHADQLLSRLDEETR
jgi:bifunctional DNA-binding transcriptional regulator/antitoxin component of YhaV-PrlF toxin-antitoxin module